jgi:hypothetical protein
MITGMSYLGERNWILPALRAALSSFVGACTCLIPLTLLILGPMFRSVLRLPDSFWHANSIQQASYPTFVDVRRRRKHAGRPDLSLADVLLCPGPSYPVTFEAPAL